jgi:hypothetical protein
VSEIKSTATETTSALEQISGDVGNKRTTLDTTVCMSACGWVGVLSRLCSLVYCLHWWQNFRYCAEESDAFSLLSCQVTSLLGDVDVAVKKARLAVQSTSETANTILKDVVTATEVKMTILNTAIYYGY